MRLKFSLSPIVYWNSVNSLNGHKAIGPFCFMRQFPSQLDCDAQEKATIPTKPTIFSEQIYKNNVVWCCDDIWVSWKRWSFAKRTTNNHSIKLMWYQVYRWRCIYLSKWKTIFWLRPLIFHICICFKLLPVPHTHTYVVGHEGIFSIMKFGAHAFFGLCATDSVRGIDFRPNY